MKSTDEVLAYLVACYPNASVSPHSLAVYSSTLQHLDVDTLERAARQHVAYNKFFPAISELLAPVVREQLPAGARQTADEAWTVVTNSMPTPQQTYEEYSAVRRALGPFLMDVVDSIGGWSFVMSQNADVARRAFVTTFNAMRDRLVARTTAGVARLQEGDSRGQIAG